MLDFAVYATVNRVISWLHQGKHQCPFLSKVQSHSRTLRKSRGVQMQREEGEPLAPEVSKGSMKLVWYLVSYYLLALILP